MTHRPATRRRVVVVAAAASLLLTGILTPAALARTLSGDSAEAPGYSPPVGNDRNRATTGSAAVTSRLGIGPGSYAVTLLTGDRVLLAVDNQGGSAVEVVEAPRPDGSTPAVEVTTTDTAIYAIPDDVLPLLAAHLLDEQLFNVAYLVANGYDDEQQQELPLIVEYTRESTEEQLVERAEKLPGSAAPVVGLESVNSAGVGLDKKELPEVWATLNRASTSKNLSRTASASGLAAGVEKVTLDHRATVTLDVSVPQIGAPQAWANGFDGSGVKVAVLDTGIDAGHPDVVDTVTASKSFIAGQEVADGHGHGTHVASTIVGSGAASEGKYKGVAPGADLLVGKVLSNSGSGSLAGIIEGMEWATLEQGADVVSMSLSCGGCAADGTDPQDQALNELTEQTGAVFVVAAGNSGPGSHSIGSPGSADHALTVAAVDKSDELAGFSSRGPRNGDQAIKPDIAAPGVEITAARADGTALGPIVGERYTTISGTSMATPHVAGAAAILAQKHPDWTAAQLRPALMSTSVDAGFSVYEQGAGRVDVARAISQVVFATTTSVDFKNVRPEDPPANRTVTYTNLGSEPVTLDLTTKVRSKGGPVPGGTLTVEPASVTVPAGGTADAAVTLSPPGNADGLYTGAVVATGPSGTRLSTPVGFTAFSELTVTLNGRQHDPETQQCATISVFGVDGAGDGTYNSRNLCWQEPTAQQRSVTFAVPSGAYFAAARTLWQKDGRIQSAYLYNQESAVSGVAEIVLDADEAKPVTLETPQPAVVEAETFTWRRISTGGSRLVTTVSGGGPDTWVTPTEQAALGNFVLAPLWILGAPRTEDRTVGELPYVYALRPYLNSVSNPPRFKFSPAELALVENYFHVDPGSTGTADLTWEVWRPESGISGFDLFAAGSIRQISVPQTIPVYAGPVSTGSSYNLFLQDNNPRNEFREGGLYRFDDATRYEVHWNERPIVPGPVLTPTRVGLPPEIAIVASLAFRLFGCSGCREGNTFNGLIQLTTPSGRHNAGYVGAESPWISTPPKPPADEGMRLFRGDQEIPSFVHYPCDGHRHTGGPCVIGVGSGGDR